MIFLNTALKRFAAGRALAPPYGEEPSPGLLEMVNRVRWLEPYVPIVVDQNIDRELALIIAQESDVTLPGVGYSGYTRDAQYINGSLTFTNPWFSWSNSSRACGGDGKQRLQSKF